MLIYGVKRFVLDLLGQGWIVYVRDQSFHAGRKLRRMLAADCPRMTDGKFHDIFGVIFRPLPICG